MAANKSAIMWKFKDRYRGYFISQCIILGIKLYNYYFPTYKRNICKLKPVQAKSTRFETIPY